VQEAAAQIGAASKATDYAAALLLQLPEESLVGMQLRATGRPRATYVGWKTNQSLLTLNRRQIRVYPSIRKSALHLRQLEARHHHSSLEHLQNWIKVDNTEACIRTGCT
jgi:hypothetical protein